MGTRAAQICRPHGAVGAKPTAVRAWTIVALALGAAGLGGGAFAGCGSGDLQLCGQIPSGGCPLGRGGSCDDVACRGLYDCVEGQWTIVTRCSGVDGGGGAAAGGSGGSSGGSGGSSGAGGCVGVALDHTGEVQGCTPELELPDCPAAVAESCQPCLSGCSDFFLCMPEGWLDVAFCTDEGQIVVNR
jgi:hypothetical protein